MFGEHYLQDQINRSVCIEMKSNIHQTAKLKYSKIINPREVYESEMRYDSTRQKWVKVRTSTTKSVKPLTSLRDSNREDRQGNRYSRPIQLYRWWFLNLKLALELEEQGYAFVQRRKKSKGRGKNKGYDFVEVKRRVIVKRSKYQGWDLNQVKTLRFNEWWQTHKDMFVEIPKDVRLIDDPRDISKNEHTMIFQVDTRTNIEDSIRAIRSSLTPFKSKGRTGRSTTGWEIIGKPSLEGLFNQYNALLMYLDGKSDKEMLSWGKYRSTRKHTDPDGIIRDTQIRFHKEKKGKTGAEDQGHGSLSSNAENIRKLLDPARTRVLTVADGDFASNGKDYFAIRK